MTWDKLKHFYEVARCGSFTKAAVHLNISQSALSKSVADLEYYYKTLLLIRHPRGVVLTKAGEVLFNHVRNMIAEEEAARTFIRAENNEVQGMVKIAAPYGFSSNVLFKYLLSFMDIYPKLELCLICNDENLDLTIREADVAIRPKEIRPEGLIQHYLKTRTLGLYASSSYLKEFGTPEKPEDLDNHRLIAFANPNHSLPYANTLWQLTVGAKLGHVRKPCLTVNSVECLFQAAIDGRGIITLSDDSALLENSNLVQVLPDIDLPKTDMYFIYHEKLADSKTVTILYQYLREAFKQN